jgi:hypothetical protein
MNFLKHVGKHSDRKVCILWREVPNEDHMALVIYPDVLPAPWEDAIMRVLESDMGQQAEQFSDALHRSLLPDGRLILETLHHEKMIKKIRSADILVTPRSDSSIRLDELNNILREMKTGEAAVKRMAENDAARGLVDPQTKRTAEAAYKAGRVQAQNDARAVVAQDGALSDRELAANMLAQAQRMEADARSLAAEAARMKKEAERMDPTVISESIPSSIVQPTAIAVDTKDVVDSKPKSRRARSAKAQVANAAQ